MWTLNYPIRLPKEHSFFDNGQYPIPDLPGGLSINCISPENNQAGLEFGLVILKIAGFPSATAAQEFAAILRAALHIASLDSRHSIAPPDTVPTISSDSMFDGLKPAVTQSKAGSSPYYMHASVQTGIHISVLSKLITSTITSGAADVLRSKPELELALELFSTYQFAGKLNAQFIVLMTALEILIPNGGKSGKRGFLVRLVKDALAKAGHEDPKGIGGRLHDLYQARNELLHEGKPVTEDDLSALRDIAKLTFKSMLFQGEQTPTV